MTQMTDKPNARTEQKSNGRAANKLRALRRRMRNESGAFLTEYAIVVPFFFIFVFIALELSYLKVREVALDRAMDRSFRELRLGLINNPSIDALKDRICADELSFLLPDCNDNLKLQLVPLGQLGLTPGFNPDDDTLYGVNSDANPLNARLEALDPGGLASTEGGDPRCVDLTPEAGVDPVVDFNPGGQNDLVLARACLFQRALFPPTQWGLDVLNRSRNSDEGDLARNFRIFSVSAFVNEPT